MRRLLIALGLTMFAVVCGVVFLWPQTRTGTEAIVYGRDTCAYCRMHLSQPGFAGEVRDGKGVLTKYDDIGCMLRAMLAMRQEMPEAWVEDHEGGGFLPLVGASLVRAASLETPMGHGIVAFKDDGTARAFAQAHAGRVVTLEDVLRDPSLFVPARRAGDAQPTG